MKSGQILLVIAGLIIIAVIVSSSSAFRLPVPARHPENPLFFPRLKSDPTREKISHRSTTSTRIPSRVPQYFNISDYRMTVTGLTNTTDVLPTGNCWSDIRIFQGSTLHCVEGWMQPSSGRN